MERLNNIRSFLRGLLAPGSVLVVRRAVTTVAFQLLRFVFGAFQAIIWTLNGTAMQVREAHRSENYETSAQVLDIRWMHKFCDVQLFAMDNFICTHNRSVVNWLLSGVCSPFNNIAAIRSFVSLLVSQLGQLSLPSLRGR